jgi:uncharacterized DUF497 family protein
MQRVEFEFDPAKDEANRRKHGVGLAFGAEIFEDGDHLVLPTIREGDEEDRYLVVGLVGGKFWTAVHVWRGPRVRFISVRRSKKGEQEAYRSD